MTDRPELVFGLVAPLGANIELVTEKLKGALRDVGYQYSVLRLSSFMHERLELWNGDVPREREHYIDIHQKVGNEFRRAHGSGDALARAAALIIRERRTAITGNADLPAAGHAFIVRQLKHPEEVHFLRSVYGGGFILIAANADPRERIETLTREIAESHQDSMNLSRYRGSAQALIIKDVAEDDDLGQQVRDTYPLADLFLDSSNAGPLETSIRRFIELVFGAPFHTPTREEYLMFQAHSASLRSADLSRQVGAVIASADGSVCAVGINEVPKVGGGQYCDGDSPDNRDFRKGRDEAHRLKKETLGEVLGRLNEWFTPAHQVPPLNPQARTDEAANLLKGTRLMGLSEFGRMVHAEMAAITDAARRGVRIQDHVLFSTTFPCHNCAKHIIAAGLKIIVFMDPYPKSLMSDLHKDEIEDQVLRTWIDIEGVLKQPRPRVVVSAYLGIAPRRHEELFAMGVRKKRDGTIAAWTGDEATPRVCDPDSHILCLPRERAAADSLGKYLRTSQPPAPTGSG